VKRLLFAFAVLVALFLFNDALFRVVGSKAPRTSAEQTCEKCGAAWSVHAYAGQSLRDDLPESVEWCRSCGTFCEVGFDFIISIFDEHGKTGGVSDATNEAFVRHCQSCEGCKCAAFSPAEWAELQKNGMKLKGSPRCLTPTIR